MKSIVIITGGSSGVGKELAKQFLQRKENVCLIARNDEKLQKTKKELEKLYSGDIITYSGDISDEKFVKDVFKDLSKHYELTCLVNNAGAGRFGTIYENNAKNLKEIFSAIVFGTILMTTNALPLLKKRADLGEIVKIVNIVSISGLRGFKFESAYCAAKAAQEGYSQVLRQELFGTNIKVVNVYPGGIDTDFWAKNRNYVSKEVQSTFAKPNEVAQTIVDNLYDKNSLVLKDIVFEQTHMNLE